MYRLMYLLWAASINNAVVRGTLALFFLITEWNHKYKSLLKNSFFSLAKGKPRCKKLQADMKLNEILSWKSSHNRLSVFIDFLLVYPIYLCNLINIFLIIILKNSLRILLNIGFQVKRVFVWSFSSLCNGRLVGSYDTHRENRVFLPHSLTWYTLQIYNNYFFCNNLWKGNILLLALARTILYASK